MDNQEKGEKPAQVASELNDRLGEAYSKGWADGEREGRLSQHRIQLGIMADRDRYRLVLELIIKRNKMMNSTICLDMLEKEAKRALGDA